MRKEGVGILGGESLFSMNELSAAPVVKYPENNGEFASFLTCKQPLWISRFLKCCIYFFMSCILFHAIIVLYGAPLIESVTETFLFAVLLSTFTTLQCLCMLGPNIQAWIRVFSKNGATSIWENSLQITTTCSILGAWFGAFPIPLDWDRPWQVWPISCSLGATFGYMAGLIIAPLWIHWNRKQLTYKSR
nr:phosphatidylinositol-glycan biosynthesis class F protein isoform X4 [Anser cygnoides]